MTGHGGSRAAEYLKDHLFENLMKHPEFIKNTKLAISELKYPTFIIFHFSNDDVRLHGCVFIIAWDIMTDRGC